MLLQAHTSVQTQPVNLQSRFSEVLPSTATSVTSAVQISTTELSDMHAIVLWNSKIAARDVKVALANACVASSITFYAEAARLTAEAELILQPVSEMHSAFPLSGSHFYPFFFARAM